MESVQEADPAVVCLILLIAAVEKAREQKRACLTQLQGGRNIDRGVIIDQIVRTAAVSEAAGLSQIDQTDVIAVVDDDDILRIEIKLKDIYSAEHPLGRADLIEYVQNLVVAQISVRIAVPHALQLFLQRDPLYMIHLKIGIAGAVTAAGMINGKQKNIAVRIFAVKGLHSGIFFPVRPERVLS